MAKRLKVGQALERALEDEHGNVTGRVTFQLEQVWNTKHGSTYGPYGPYWYMYWWQARGALYPAHLGRLRSRYLGSPERFDPSDLSPSELGKLMSAPTAHLPMDQWSLRRRQP